MSSDTGFAIDDVQGGAQFEGFMHGFFPFSSPTAECAGALSDEVCRLLQEKNCGASRASSLDVDLSGEAIGDDFYSVLGLVLLYSPPFAVE